MIASIPEVRVAFEKDINELKTNLQILRSNFTSVNLGLAESIMMLETLEKRFNIIFESNSEPEHRKHWQEGKHERVEI